MFKRNNLLFSVIFVFMLQFPYQSIAGMSCIEIFTQSSNSYKRAHLAITSELKNSTSQRFLEQSLDQVAPYLNKMDVPKVEVSIQDLFVDFDGMISSVTAHYNIKEGKIFLNTKTYLNRDANLRASFLHELGHHVFIENIGQYLPEFTKSLDQLRSHPNKNSINKKMTNVLKVSIPYQELFSDLLAVVSMKKPQAIRDLVKDDHRSTDNHRNNFEARSFSGSLLDKVWTEREEHLLLAPVRSYLWEHYFSKIRTQEEAAELIEIVFRVSMQEIVDRSSTKRGTEMSPEAINLSLLRSLHSELASHTR